MGLSHGGVTNLVLFVMASTVMFKAGNSGLTSRFKNMHIAKAIIFFMLQVNSAEH